MNSNGAALRVVPADENPQPMGAAPNAPGAHGLNTLRAVADYGPSELTELDDEIAVLLDKADKLQFQRQYLTRLLAVATEYYELRER
jgi:hypothetical protein